MGILRGLRADGHSVAGGLVLIHLDVFLVECVVVGTWSEYLAVARGGLRLVVAALNA